MPAQIGSLFVSLTADVRPYAQGMATAERVTTQATSRISRSAGIADRSVQSFWGSVSNQRAIRPYSLIAVSRAFDNAADRAGLLRGALLATTAVAGGFTAALSSNLILRYADSFTKLTNQVRVVSDGSADLTARFEELQNVATRSWSSLEATAILYSRIQKATPDRSADEILRYVETIQKALVLGGATAQEARSAAIQFSQAIASNRLGGEELRAILETPLGLELARGLGVTIGRLREMGHAGKLTSEVVLGALSKVAEGVDRQFNRSIQTVDQGLTFVDNKLTEYFGDVNQAYGATRLLAGAIIGFGNNLDTIIPILGQVAGGLAALFVGRLAGRIAGAGGTVIGQIRAEATQARESLIDLRAEQGRLTKALVETQSKRTSLAFAAPATAADKSAIKEYERAQFRLAELDKQKLALVEKQKAVVADLGAVTTKTSSKAISLASDQVAAENRLNAALAKQGEIQQSLRVREAISRVQPRITPAQQKFEAERTKALIQSYSTLEKQIARERQTIANRQIRVSELVTSAERKAADERIALLRSEERVRRDIADVDALRTRAALDARTSQRGVIFSGSGNIQQQEAELVRQSAVYRTALNNVNQRLIEQEKLTTRLGQAKVFLGRQLTSIIGLFGGPWGLAITGAIVGLSYLGIRAQEEAQKVANAQKIIQEAVERAGRSASGDAAIRAQQSVAEKRAQETAKQIKIVEGEFDRLRETVTDAATVDFAPFTSSMSRIPPVLVAAKDRLLELVDRLQRGEISADKFAAEVETISKETPGIERMAKAAANVAKAMQDAAIAANQLRSENAKIDGGLPTGVPFENTLRTAEEDVLKIEQRVQLSRLRAQGLTAEARAHEYVAKAAEAGRYVSYTWVLQKFKEIEANDKAAMSLRSVGRSTESFAEKIKELRQEAAGALLPDVDRDVLKFAEKLKNAEKIMADYIAAVKSGNLSAADPRLLEVRDALLQKQAAEATREIIKEYGNFAQIAPLAAEKQEILNRAVERGYITAGQARLAYSDFLSQFGAYKWIDRTSDAFGSFITQALDGTTKLSDAWKNFQLSLRRVLIEEFVAAPLKMAIRSIIQELIKASAQAAFFKNILGGLFGGFGGSLGSGPTTGTAGGLPALHRDGGIIKAAPGGFVSGPGSSRSDSILARLSDGEFVVNARQTAKYRKLLEAINSGDMRLLGLPGFVAGGLVSSAMYRPRSLGITAEAQQMQPARSESGGDTHHWNVTTPDAPSFLRSQAQLEAMVTRVADRGRRGM